MGKPIEVVSPDRYWPCACVKRRKGMMTHIKVQHPSVAKCRVCGVTREDSERAAGEVK